MLNKAPTLRAALTALMTIIGLAGLTHSVQAAPPAGYTLTWSDEFNGVVGSGPSVSNWIFDLGTGTNGWGNNEQESYVQDTAHCSIVSDSAATDGKALKITATRMGSTYESARILTQGKHTVTYGYIEIRAKNPTGQGIWPAFWMLGTDVSTATGWPACGEQDIMELFGQNDGTNMGSFHLGSSASPINWTGSYTLPNNAKFNQAYHTFGLLWTQTGVTTYVDGVQYETHPSTSPGWIFNHPNFYILNLAVGGNGPGNVNGTTPFPQSLYVDYIREYSGPQTNSPGALGTSIDKLHDFSTVYNTSGNWTIDKSNPSFFNGSTGRACRLVNATETINYKYKNINNFSVEIYNYQIANASAVTIWYSTNHGLTYTQANITYSSRFATSGGWGRFSLAKKGVLPAGVTDLQVQIAPTNFSWDTQIAQVDISHS